MFGYGQDTDVPARDGDSVIAPDIAASFGLPLDFYSSRSYV
jgi:hypothetical protein